MKNNKIKIISNINITNIENFLIKKKFKVEKSLFEDFYSQTSKIKNNRDVIILNQIEGLIKINEKKSKYYEKDIDIYIQSICELSKKSKKIILFDFIYDPSIINSYYNFNAYEMHYKKNIDYINSKIKFKLSKYKNIHFINLLHNFNTEKVYDYRMWYYIRNPYSIDFQNHISKIIQKFYSNANNKIKLIVLDLDNTLWGNTLGEVGYNNILVGKDNPISESFLDFQKYLKNLKKAGIVLAVSSKNYEKNVMEVFKKNKNMILKKNDFVMMKINWENKSKNIAFILKSLNLKPRDVAFIDDNHLERSEVQKIFPDMIVPEMPKNPIYYLSTLLNIDELKIIQNSNEDSKRTQMYQGELKRQNYKNITTNLNQWKKRLRMTLNVRSLGNINKERVNQLYLKTNQINFASSRSKDSEAMIIDTNNKKYFVFDLKDSYGDSGIIGFVEAEIIQKKLLISEFIMSCRVYGRDVEFSMLNFVIKNLTKKFKITNLNIIYRENKKNELSKEILKKYLKIKNPNKNINIKISNKIFYKCDHIKTINNYDI